MGYAITADNYFKKNQPSKSEELKNVVRIPVSPLALDDFDDELYISGTPLDFANAETKTIEIEFSDIPTKSPEAKAYITDAEGELLYHATTGNITNTELNITTETYYAWGAGLVITNNTGSQKYIVIVVSGYPLIVKGGENIESRDEDGIIENGILVHELKANHLIQDRELGKNIADTLLDSYKTARKDINLDWRGNLDLNLRDEITVPEYDKNDIYTEADFIIFKQTSDYDGTFKQATNGRKK